VYIIKILNSSLSTKSIKFFEFKTKKLKSNLIILNMLLHIFNIYYYLLYFNIFIIIIIIIVAPVFLRSLLPVVGTLETGINYYVLT